MACAWHLWIALLLTSALPGAAAEKPRLTLWAWDRAEDLRFLKPGEADVAALLATYYIHKPSRDVSHRKLPLILRKDQSFEAVIRIEAAGGPDQIPEDFAWELASSLFRDPRINSIQVDFDAPVSMRGWYAEMLRKLRARVPRVTMTALASWCIDKPWFFDKVSVEDVVPMLFRMGPSRNAVLQRLAKQGDFSEACRGTVGLSTDEPLAWRPPARRAYLFNPRRWTREDFDGACERLQLR